MPATANTTREPFQPTFNPFPLDRNTYRSCICVYSTASDELKMFVDRYGVQLQGLTIESKHHLLEILRRWQGRERPRYSIYEAIVDHLHAYSSRAEVPQMSEAIDSFALERLENLSDSEVLHLLSHLETWKSES
jgi:hypothetical protein